MARRGEGQFVAMECNLHQDPVKCGRVARALKVSRNEAYGIIGAWRDLVLNRGEGLTGILRGYPAADIADWCGWKGKPAKLIAALTEAGELASRRNVYRHPTWVDTPTGWYASKRAGDRDRKRHGGSAESPRNGDGASAPAPSGSGQEVSNSAPQPPPEGGGDASGARAGLADWFFETHPRVRNESECRRLLGAMTEAQAAQLRYCLPRQRAKYISGMTNRKGRGVPWADVYLRHEFYFEFRPAKPKAATNGHTKLEEQREKADLVAREAAFWARRDLIKERVKLEGASLTKFELEARVDEELAKEEQQGASPS
jgi:hypothetical protein